MHSFRLLSCAKRLALAAVAIALTMGAACAQTIDTRPSTSTELKLVIQGSTSTLDAAQLLQNPRLAEIPLTKDPFYGAGARTYLAVPLTALIDPDKVTGGPSFQFRSKDGFVATVPAQALLNRDPGAPIAWIAIEPPAAGWPPLPARGPRDGRAIRPDLVRDWRGRGVE